jgi:two-component system, cell cycle sensor histidine kinase and response regulator CckA
MPGNPFKILLVDDDEDDYIITRDLIARIGDRRYHLDWINNYDAGLAAVWRAEHDICLLDYRLGERTGLELLRESQTFNGRPPMILLTGQGDHEIDIEAMKAGAADYLIKSQLNTDTLDRAIRYAIQGRQTQEHLRRERDLISRIMATSPVSIVVTDQSGKIIFANHCAEKILGLAKGDVDSRTACVLDWHLADSEGNSITDQPLPLKQVLESGRLVQDVFHAIDFPNNRRVLISTNAAPLFDAAGKIDGMVVTLEDITERLALEAQLRQSQKMESVGQLAAGVAHDINNILTIIQGHAGLLLNTAPPNGDAARSLKQISAASERAASFIRHLLMFSRKQVFQTKILDLNAVLRNLEYMLPRMLGEHIALETCYHPGLPPIAADTSMIEQIVMNLMVNSRDAMPGGGKLLIETSAIEIGAAHVRQNPEACAGGFVCLTVTDTGCGIERKLLPRIFEPFFTTKEIGKGTGLGLATVYGIVKQHHGWVEVESEVGVGTTFKVFLPVTHDVAVAVPAAAPKSETVNGGEETILVVEDEIGLLELVRNVLQRYHYRVLIASSGVEALRVWDEQDGRIDILLTDMIMPGGVTGSDLAAELKKRKPALKVIFTSGYSSELVGRDFGHGDTSFLPKPYQPHQVARMIRETLDAAPKNQQPGPVQSNGVHILAA